MSHARLALLIATMVAAVSCSGSAEGLSWTTFRDPSESAFSLEVPSGWQVSGGLNRMAAVDLRPAVQAVSPDGRISVSFGDARLPTFVAPNQMMLSMGFTEGSPYSPGYGVMMQVLRYLPGEHFASWWVRSRFQGATMIAAHRLDDASASMSRAWAAFAQYGTRARVDVGEVAFEVEGRRGGVVAGTLYLENAGMVTWRAEHLAGYLAPPEFEGVARQVVQRMVGSFRLSPEWASRQQGLTGGVSEIVATTSDALSDSMHRSWKRRQASDDRIAQQRSEAMLGVESWRDTVTGEVVEVESGWEHYWIDPAGRVVGTRIDDPPGRHFRRLEPPRR